MLIQNLPLALRGTLRVSGVPVMCPYSTPTRYRVPSYTLIPHALEQEANSYHSADIVIQPRYCVVVKDVEKGISAVHVESCANHEAASGESCGDDIHCR